MMTWKSLSYIKESFPTKVAEYAQWDGIIEEPEFFWWVPYILKKRRAILVKVKSKYWNKTHKYYIKVPKTLNQAKHLDKNNGNTIRMDSFDK